MTKQHFTAILNEICQLTAVKYLSRFKVQLWTDASHTNFIVCLLYPYMYIVSGLFRCIAILL